MKFAKENPLNKTPFEAPMTFLSKDISVTTTRHFRGGNATKKSRRPETPAERPAGVGRTGDGPALCPPPGSAPAQAPQRPHVMRSAPAVAQPAPTIRSQGPEMPAGPMRPGPADDAAAVRVARPHT